MKLRRIVLHSYLRLDALSLTCCEQERSELWFTHAQFHPLYLLSRHDVAHMTSHTRPSHFLACNIESWVGPGDEAISLATLHFCHVFLLLNVSVLFTH